MVRFATAPDSRKRAKNTIIFLIKLNDSGRDSSTEFPDLKTLQIQACLDYARELAEFEEVA